MKFRQVHLDFHTSEHIFDIGEKFDKKQFQEALKKGHVDSVTLFSKCHHGWAYHPSKANDMHPNLSFDLLKAQLDAAHEIDVKTPIYLSAGLDEKIVMKHSEWAVRNRDESTTWAKSFTEAGYHKLCFNTPYLDYLLNQIKEVCENYHPDGIFLDICGVQPCYCISCINSMREKGLNVDNEEDVIKHAENVYRNYTTRVRETIESVVPGLPVFHNGGHIRQGRRDIIESNTHLELESLPTGGWGYDHFPLSARYAQNLGLEYLGMTGKFHTRWGEFGGFKHPNALRYEVSLSVANGAKCSIGDQLHPNGSMDMATYELIGDAYKELEEKEPWIDNVRSVADIGVISSESVTDAFGTGQIGKNNSIDAGVCRIMLEGKYLFDIIDTEMDFEKYKVIVLPDVVFINDKLKKKLNAFIKHGGKILATGKSGLDGENKFAFDLGAEYLSESVYSPTYMRPCRDNNAFKDTAYVIYAQTEKVSLSGKEYAKVESPCFNRTAEHFCSHQHAPSSGETEGVGICEGKDGIYIAWGIFDEYATCGSLIAKKIVCFAIDKLLGKEKTLCTNLPAQGIATLMNQENENRFILHMLYATPVKRGISTEIIEDIIPVYNITAELKIDKKIKKVYLAPQMKTLDFIQKNDSVAMKIDELECHQMIVLDY